MLLGTGAKHAKDEVKEFIKRQKYQQLSHCLKGILADAPNNIGNLGKIGTKRLINDTRC